MDEELEHLILGSVKNKQIFIVEGPDGVGKTTLCNILQILFSLPIIHLTYLSKELNMERQYQYVYELISNIGFNLAGGIIFDRFLTSNAVYSAVFKNSSIVHWRSHIIDKLNFLAARGSRILFIHCLIKNKAEYLKRYERLCKERNELYNGQIKQMSEVYDKYIEEWELEESNLYDHRINHVNYDISDIQEPHILELKDIVEKFENIPYCTFNKN